MDAVPKTAEPDGTGSKAVATAERGRWPVQAKEDPVEQDLGEFDSAVKVVHEHCGIFTRPEVARGVLDAVGWTEKGILLNHRLLEPACGDGSFLLPAAKSLVASLRRQGHEISQHVLRHAILAFEFEERTAEKARERLRSLLEEEGLPSNDAGSVVDEWVRCEDFLLATEIGDFTHIVGNPPYLRWSKVPKPLRNRYEASLPASVARGDLCLPFLWRAIELTEALAGSVAFVCADRWLRCAYGERVRSDLSRRVRVACHVEVHDAEVFAGSRRVDAYAAVTILDRKLDAPPTFARARSVPELLETLQTSPAEHKPLSRPKAWTNALRAKGNAIIAPPDLVQAYESLEGPRLSEAGVTVRCGLALGFSEAFVVDDDCLIEADRLMPFVRAKDLRTDGSIETRRRVINVWADDGLVRLADYPLMRAHLELYTAELRKRVCVTRPDQWYRTIDRVRLERFAAPKILIAGMAVSARIAFSNGGVQPSNSLYALTSTEWPLRALFTLLRSGVLELFATVLAPTFSGGTKRYDGNVLSQVRLPHWRDVGEQARRVIASAEGRSIVISPDLIALVYGLKCKRLKVLEKALIAVA